MTDPRRYHGAVLLGDGRVLVSGGLTDQFTRDVATGDRDYTIPIAYAEVYDPSTETWSPVGDMPEEKGRHTLELLENGKVLATGGSGPSAALALFAPSSGIWASVDEPPIVGEFQTSVFLGDGKVLLIGGWIGNAPIDSAQLYDPLTDSWSPTGGIKGEEAGN